MDKYKNALSKIAKLCSSSEKCSFDMYNKLLSYDLTEEEATKAIKYLKENKFIDDNRFAEMFVKDKFRINGWGKIKIAYALRHKQIPDDIIDDALSIISNEEYSDLLDRLIAGKLKARDNISKSAVKAKVFRFAAQRGFSSEDIYNSLERIAENMYGK